MNPCFSPANILLPDFNKVDAYRWAAIACDQFTSEPEYWEDATAIVGDAPSTLRLFLPEAYLEAADDKIPTIQATMKQYLSDVLCEHPESMIYVERTQSDGAVRHGLVLAVDLECYDYTRGSSSLIRATEATVLERIPPRVAIRRGADVELPHVMLLIDDPKHTVLEPLADGVGKVAYDTPLMKKGGHIRGRYLSDEEKARVTDALCALITPDEIAARYGDASLSPLLFAVGDGNHSLASAKAAYEEIKTAIGAEAALSHPARYALAEVVNIHDDALRFEPIYRVMFGVDPTALLNGLRTYAASLTGTAAAQTVHCRFGAQEETVVFEHPALQLTVGTLQTYLDAYLAEHPEASVDYIHGEASVAALSAREDAVGFLFDGMQKSELFRTVIFDGALPRKTFSMGHAEDKRYYLECRRITKSH